MKGDWISHDTHRLALGCMGLGGSWNDKSYDQNHIKQAHSAIETALEEGEIITAVRMPIPEASNYQKFEQPASRFALVGVFVAKYASGVRVAVTGASEGGVFRWSEAEAALGSNFSADALADLSIAQDDMIQDLHGSKAYRAHMVKVMTSRAVAAAG